MYPLSHRRRLEASQYVVICLDSIWIRRGPKAGRIQERLADRLVGRFRREGEGKGRRSRLRGNTAMLISTQRSFLIWSVSCLLYVAHGHARGKGNGEWFPVSATSNQSRGAGGKRRPFRRSLFRSIIPRDKISEIAEASTESCPCHWLPTLWIHDIVWSLAEDQKRVHMSFRWKVLSSTNSVRAAPLKDDLCRNRRWNEGVDMAMGW